ncbi:MAG: DUF1957 domain-containing protein [Treponema sp.]|jgi:1,4-alpha-glucan branching enzyme|nr:DUF1957 domain-containing protein [Treponema sp.]
MNKPRLSIIINGHYPFISPGGEQDPEEQGFFEALSETYLPLLETLGRLENSRVPFRLGLVLSPSLCAMLEDETLLKRYLAWLDRRVDFGGKELERCAGNQALSILARYYFDRDLERRVSLVERYGLDLLSAFEGFQKRGCLELLISAATGAFLPFYASIDEAIHAQIETAVIHHRRYLGKIPRGFWLPELGWTSELGSFLRQYHFTYTIVEPHALILGNPPALGGSFRPVKTKSGLVIFARDITAQKDLEELKASWSGFYQGSFADAGYELPVEALKPLLDAEGGRCPTGYRYWAGEKDRRLYDPQKAREAAAEAARRFLDRRVARLEAAQRRLEGEAISLWAFDAAALGYSWSEGMTFLETLVTEIALKGALSLKTPLDYLEETGDSSFQVVEPEFSSALEGGYGGLLLDASNDWMYRHIFRSIQRMIEMAGRFPGSTGLKERALNQAAREILLAQSADLAKPLNPQWKGGPLGGEYAKKELEDALLNFTTLYEALGSNHISTEWLTALERKHSFLPHINYRVFEKKK